MRRGCGTDELYESLARHARDVAQRFNEPADRLDPLSGLLWDALSTRGLSWVGFYILPDMGIEAPHELVLAARRDKPACSPIGLHGACGQSLLEESVRLIEDVALLGEGYIACDPRDRSEVVLPIYRNGNCWGVLDADSHEQACFGSADVRGLARVLREAGLLDRDPPLRADRLPEADLQPSHRSL
ncbi:MAG: hypothetical protein RL136_730 [Planctomycetota bacterium]|jgi:putative methionine-R-sulfoxide reductase with GAF domain